MQEGYYEAQRSNSVPVIDGVGDDTCWAIADWAPIDQVWLGDAVTAIDYSGKFKVIWTSKRLYLLIEIVDDSLHCQPTDVTDVFANIYQYDCVEVFIDENNSRETDYSNSHKAFAYHLDTAGDVGYANGNTGWERLDDHFNYKVKKVAAHTYDWELEMKVFNDKFVYGGNNTPVTLNVGKLMGWSLAYNDNDFGTTRQNMFGSVLIAGDNKNVSYYNSSVFGKLLLKSGDTITSVNKIENPFPFKAYCLGDRIIVSFVNPDNENTNMQLFDIFGREIEKVAIIKTTGFVEKELSVPGLPKGIYFIKIASLKNQVVKKIML
jgi:hypothetical protein